MKLALHALARHSERIVASALVLTLIVMLALQARLLPVVNVNWDEFYFLSKIYMYGRGELAERLLTFHVHLFGWIPATLNEVDQVVLLRHAMLALSAIGTAAFVLVGYALTKSVPAALVGAVAWHAFSYQVLHGASARFDPPVATLCLLALATLATPSLRLGLLRPAIAGLFLAISLLVSIKTVVWAPCIAVVLWHAQPSRAAIGLRCRDTLKASAQLVACLAVALLLLGGWHLSTLAPPSANATGIAMDGGGLLSIARVQFGGAELLRQVEPLQKSWMWDRYFWVLMLLSTVTTLATRPSLLLLFGPLLSVVLYRNAFAYYYVTIIPPAALVLTHAVSLVEARLTAWWRVLFVVGIVAPFLFLTVQFVRFNDEDKTNKQRRVLEAVHQIFPEPVAYVDRCSMVATHIKVGPFFSTWNLARYRAARTPVFADLWQSRPPQFLLANVNSLELLRKKKPSTRYVLLPEDTALLRDSFVPHWGPVFVAGKALSLVAGQPQSMQVHIAGIYRLHAKLPIRVDGQQVLPQGTVELGLGVHEVVADDDVNGTLKVASAGPAPTDPPPKGKLFSKFDFETKDDEDD